MIIAYWKPYFINQLCVRQMSDFLKIHPAVIEVEHADDRTHALM